MLAISTATKKAYIALSYNGKNFYSEVDADCRQSENIMKEIDDILEKNKISFHDVGNIAVVVGPGSFTGERIGVALVKGLCAGDPSHKIIPISTLDLMANIYFERNNPTEDFYCVMNALSKRFFVSKYNTKGKKICDEKMAGQEQVFLNKNKIVLLEEEFPGLENVNITSEALLKYAEELEKREKFIKVEMLTPIYIRKPQAEENLDGIE